MQPNDEQKEMTNMEFYTNNQNINDKVFVNFIGLGNSSKSIIPQFHQFPLIDIDTLVDNMLKPFSK